MAVRSLGQRPWGADGKLDRCDARRKDGAVTLPGRATGTSGFRSSCSGGSPHEEAVGASSDATSRIHPPGYYTFAAARIPWGNRAVVCHDDAGAVPTAVLPLDGAGAVPTAALPLDGAGAVPTAVLPLDGAGAVPSAALPLDGAGDVPTTVVPLDGAGAVPTAALPFESSGAAACHSAPSATGHRRGPAAWDLGDAPSACNEWLHASICVLPRLCAHSRVHAASSQMCGHPGVCTLSRALVLTPGIPGPARG